MTLARTIGGHRVKVSRSTTITSPEEFVQRNTKLYTVSSMYLYFKSDRQYLSHTHAHAHTHIATCNMILMHTNKALCVLTWFLNKRKKCYRSCYLTYDSSYAFMYFLLRLLPRLSGYVNNRQQVRHGLNIFGCYMVNKGECFV